jgi:hypothetical protein
MRQVRQLPFARVDFLLPVLLCCATTRSERGYGLIFKKGGSFMPGRHVTDQQMRLFVTLRQTHTVPLAVAKAGISQATSFRLQADPTLPSQKKKPHG